MISGVGCFFSSAITLLVCRYTNHLPVFADASNPSDILPSKHRKRDRLPSQATISYPELQARISLHLLTTYVSQEPRELCAVPPAATTGVSSHRSGIRFPTHSIGVEDKAGSKFQVLGFRGGSPGRQRVKLFRSTTLSSIPGGRPVGRSGPWEAKGERTPEGRCLGSHGGDKWRCFPTVDGGVRSQTAKGWRD